VVPCGWETEPIEVWHQHDLVYTLAFTVSGSLPDRLFRRRWLIG